MAILIQNPHRRQVGTRRLQEIARTILSASDSAGTELSIVLCDDARIQELNRHWRGKDRPTDVLSFPQEGEDAGAPVDASATLGDVVISVETAQRQASAMGATLEEEVTRLLIHGILHLRGYDHVHGGHQARKMKQEEARLWRLVRRALSHK